MSLGIKQDEKGKLYRMNLVDTDQGRKAGILVREEIYVRVPESEVVQKTMHKWRIFSSGKEAEVLTTCNLYDHPQEGLRCKICRHLPGPVLQ